MKSDASIKILVIDDDKDLKATLTALHQQGEFQIDTAENGVKVLDQVDDYDLALIALNMAAMDGQECIRRIREKGNLHTALIVLADQKTLERAFQLPADYHISDVLCKPPDSPARLRFSIENALERQRLKHHLDQLVREQTAELEQALLKEKETRETMIQSRTMAALCYLVAGVSHEINTPLGNSFTLASHVREASDSFQTRLNQDELTKQDLIDFLNKIRKSSSIMLESLGRAAQIIRSFKQLAVKREKEKKREFNLLQTINSVFASLGIHKTNIEVKIECPQSLVMFSDPGSLIQVLTNLIQNSLIHGFEGQNSGKIELLITAQQSQISIVYKDNGIGMQAETVKNVFDPFFTTKTNQGSSGLGMSISYNLVNESLLGTIHCRSEPGNGVAFLIQIPQSTDKEGEK